MSVLPRSLMHQLKADLGVSVQGSAPAAGGMICHAARVHTDRGDIFVKWRHGAAPGFFRAEAAGLELLGAVGALRVPRVIAWKDAASSTGGTPYLALEFIEHRAPGDEASFGRRFGEGLARLHAEAPSPFGAYGLEYNNFLGAEPQCNTPHAAWSRFYRECRLVPQIERARRLGLLPPRREAALQTILEEVDDLLQGIPEEPCLIHGDLWSGNFLSAGNEAVLVDPAVYYGHREVELAYIELFGGFPKGFMDGYCRSFPLPEGYAYRRPLHQLYPLLIHLNHFGEAYGPHVDEVCSFYAHGLTRTKHRRSARNHDTLEFGI
ncbi:MAG: fructosamine kinase family protein [Chthonomonadales bacterium]